MKKKLLIAIAFIAFVGSIVLISQGLKYYNQKRNVITLGTLFIHSGNDAAFGEAAQDGVALAVEEYNRAKTAKKVRVIYEDTGGSSKGAVSAYMKLISVNNVDGIIGPLFQTQTSAVTPLIEKNSTPTITISPLAPEGRNNNATPIGFWPDPLFMSGKLARYVYDNGYRTVGVIGTKDIWDNEVTNGFSKEFSKIGGMVSDVEIVMPDTIDLRLEIQRIIHTNPDAIFIGTYGQFIRAVKTIREFGFEGKLFSIELDSHLAKETATLSNGTEFISLAVQDDAFDKKILTRYGHQPNIPTAQAYDAANLLLSILSQSASQNDALKKMSSLSWYNGVSGNISFSKDGKASFEATPIFELREGEIVKLIK